MVSFQWVGRLPIFFAAVIFKMNEDGLRLRKSDCAGFYMTKGAQGFPDGMIQKITNGQKHHNST